MTLLLLEMLRGNALSEFAASATQGLLGQPAIKTATMLLNSPPKTILPRGSLLDRVI